MPRYLVKFLGFNENGEMGEEEMPLAVGHIGQMIMWMRVVRIVPQARFVSEQEGGSGRFYVTV